MTIARVTAARNQQAKYWRSVAKRNGGVSRLIERNGGEGGVKKRQSADEIKKAAAKQQQWRNGVIMASMGMKSGSRS